MPISKNYWSNPSNDSRVIVCNPENYFLMCKRTDKGVRQNGYILRILSVNYRIARPATSQNKGLASVCSRITVVDLVRIVKTW